MKECRQLNPKQLAALIADGYTIHSGPYAVRALCEAYCVEDETTGTGTSTDTGTGTGEDLPNDCDSAVVVGTGTTFGPFTIGVMEEHWFVFTAPTGLAKITITVTGVTISYTVKAPSTSNPDPCSVLSDVFGGALPAGVTCHDNVNWYALMSGTSPGPHFLKMVGNAFSPTTYTFKIEGGAC